MDPDEGQGGPKMSEKWMPIPGYEGRYEVSDHGAVRGVPRTVFGRGGMPTRIAGRLLNQVVDAKGYHVVTLYRGGGSRRTVKVHRLVLVAFVGEPFDSSLQGLHRNGVPGDNRLSNLRWGSNSQNQIDSVEHGTHRSVQVTECPHGHPYSGDNLITKFGQRTCRECGRHASREYQRRKANERKVVRG